MFKGLIRKLEEENLPANGSAIRDSIRDAGQAVIKQVKDKIEAAASGSSSAAGSTTSSRTPSLIDFTPELLPAASPQPDLSLITELTATKRERDGLLLRNSQLNNLISQMKAELSEERNLRRKLEEEYKRPNEEICVNIMLEKGSQTDPMPEIVVTPAEMDQQAALDRDRDRDSLMLRNAELSNSIETLKRQLSEDKSERREIEEELQHLKSQLLLQEKQLQQELAERQRQKPADDVIPLKQHQEVVQKLEETISDKNKTIKLQLQRITDIKKSIQRGDVPAAGSASTSNHNNNSSSNFHPVPVSTAGYFSDNDSRTISPAFRRETRSPPATLDIASGIPVSENSDHAATILDVNFEYLRNVVFKFITSSEYESQKQLVKAIATLLQFNQEQEHSVRETLEWRNSWLSSLPIVGPNLKPASASAPSSLKQAPPPPATSSHQRKDSRTGSS